MEVSNNSAVAHVEALNLTSVDVQHSQDKSSHVNSLIVAKRNANILETRTQHLRPKRALIFRY